jgi:hypothetical protein
MTAMKRLYQFRTLATLRDMLLPKLLSVAGIEKEVMK